VQALLSAPNPDDPLATDVAEHCKEDEKDAQKVSREWTEKLHLVDVASNHRPFLRGLQATWFLANTSLVTVSITFHLRPRLGC